MIKFNSNVITLFGLLLFYDCMHAAENKELLKDRTFLLKSDFSKNNFSKEWKPLNGKWESKGGMLCELSDQITEKGLWITAGEKDWNNYSIETKVKYSDKYGSLLIGVGWQDINNHYEVEHQSFSPWLSFLRVWKVTDGRKILLGELDNRQGYLRTSQAELTLPRGKEAFEYKVYFYDGTITVEINNKLWMAVKDNTFKSGKVSLGASDRQLMFLDAEVRKLSSFSSPLPIMNQAQLISISQHALRHSFYRGEKIKLDIELKNLNPDTIKDAVLDINIDNGTGFKQSLQLGKIEPGKNKCGNIIIDTAAWKSGDYKLTVTLRNTNHKQQYDIYVAPQPLENRYRFSDMQSEINNGYWETLKKYGFNECRFYISPEGDFKKLQPYFAKMFDRAMKYGFKVGFCYMAAYNAERNRGKDTRITRMDGQKGNYRNFWDSKEEAFQKKSIQDFINTVKDYPALDNINVNEETDCAADISYDKADRERAKKELGFSLPSPENKGVDVDGHAGKISRVPKKVVAAMPEIFNDNNRWYSFFKWYWLRGVGDTQINMELAKIIKKTRPDINVLTMPFRSVPLSDKMKGLDMLGGWFYPLPHPSEALGQIETFRRCAADGDKLQKITYNVSLFLYNDKLCPPVNKTRAAGTQPAGYICEADWIGFSRSPDAMGHWTLYHSAKELLLPWQHKDQVQDKDLCEKIGVFSREILQPLWPTISKLENSPRKCAMLISFGSQVFGPKIWGGYGGASGFGYYAALQMAHIPTDIIFDETVNKGILRNYKVLFMHNITKLPRNVYNHILNFAQNGGTVICGDPFAKVIPNAIKFDMDMKKWQLFSYPSIEKGEGVTGDILQELQIKNANEVRKLVFDKVKPYADCNSPQTFLNLLEKDKTKYLFVINDLRTFGDYMGQYKVCMEKGLSQDVTVELEDTGLIVYDMVTHKKLKSTEKDNKTFVKLKLQPVWGAILAIYKQAIDRIIIEKPKTFLPGEPVNFIIKITESQNKNMPGIQPLEVSFTDPEGQKNEFSGYYAATDGVSNIKFIPACNDIRGKWEISVKELSSGKADLNNFDY